MRYKVISLILLSGAFLSCSNSGKNAVEGYDTRPEVAFLWVFHFKSKQNLLTQEFDDVLSEKSQREIVSLVEDLKKYKPTKIAVERPYYTNAELNTRYHQYLEGRYELTEEETDQIAFRLGKELKLDSLHVVSYSGEFNMKTVMDFAEANGQTEHFHRTMSVGKRLLSALDSIIREGSVVDGLKYMNSERAKMLNHSAYYPLMKIGSDSNRVGIDLVAEWYKTNLIIYSNIERLAEPGDRLLVIYGQGHSVILGRMVEDDPDLRLKDISGYLE